MSLEQTIKELKDQIAEEDKEAVEEQQEEATDPEKPEEEAKTDDTSEEKAEEKPEAEAKEEEKEPEDNAAWRKLRREAAAHKKLAEERERENAELRAKLETPKEDTTESAPAAPVITPELEEIIISHRMERAEAEFKAMEDKFRSSAPEYDAVASEYTRALAQSIKVQNPRLSNEQIVQRTKETILYKAAHYIENGFDPIEEMYHEAKELGFTGKTREEPKEERREVKPDMKKVAANREKSSGMAAAGGKSEGQITKQAAADFTAEQWMKLPADEKRRLMYG